MRLTGRMSPRRRTSSSVAGVGVAAALLLSACTPAEYPDAASPTPSSAPSASPRPTPTATPTPTPVPVTPRTVASGLDAPWSMAVVGDVVFVSERDTARILEVSLDGTTRVAATVEGVVHSDEGGLLGLATDGDALYVYSTARSGNRVEKYPLTGTPGSYGLGEPAAVIDGMPAGTHHNGGRIAFGPDGMLYIANGDTSDEPASQDPGSLAGKILRIAPDGGIPSDNPDPQSAVYSLGHRNVQGFAWTEDGTMFASEFGRNYRDELNIIEPGGNYGWPSVEGTGGEADGYIDPVQTWPTDAASPSGIAIVNDTILIANLRGRVLRTVPVADPSTSTELSADYGRLRDVTVGPDGTVFVLTNNTDGRGSPRDGDDRIVSLAVPRS